MQLMHNLNSNLYFLDIYFFLACKIFLPLPREFDSETQRTDSQIVDIRSNWITYPGKSLTSENGLFPAQFYLLTKICDLKAWSSLCDLRILYNEMLFGLHLNARYSIELYHAMNCSDFFKLWAAPLSIHKSLSEMSEVSWCKALHLLTRLISHFTVAPGLGNLQVYLSCFMSPCYKWEEGLGMNGMVGSAGTVFRITFFWDHLTN